MTSLVGERAPGSSGFVAIVLEEGLSVMFFEVCMSMFYRKESLTVLGN